MLAAKSSRAVNRGTRNTVKMPAPEKAILDRRAEILDRLREIVGSQAVISDDQGLAAYESDGLTAYRQKPMLVVLPSTVDEVSAVMRYAGRTGIKIVPRGAGTSLSGGALPLEDGIVLSMTRFNRILEIDLQNRCAVVQPGVTNISISEAVDAEGFYYAPDPSSQIVCTIGGNVGENSGGIHCLKYGLTTNNILGVECVLISGEVLRIGGKALDQEGYDLLGVLTGSEGLLGVITEVTVRLLPKPESTSALLLGFPTIESAGACVNAVIAGGIIPAGMELMDHFAIEATEAFCHPGYPLDAAAILIVELDGFPAEVSALVDGVRVIADQSGASSVRLAESEEERLGFWAGRKAAFPAMGRLSPDYYCMDGTIPRGALAAVLSRIAELSAEFGLRVANVFHAGDGNLHPLILYDANVEGELEAAEAFGAEILKLCVEKGGVLTGEHGVGVEKRDLMNVMFSEVDLAHQERLKCAFDPDHRLNPGKMFPVLHRCVELGRVHVHKGQIPFPDIPRF